MERLFNNIIKAFLSPINFLFYLVILIYFIAYLTGNADGSGAKLFLCVTVIANLLTGIIATLVDKNNSKKFENLYIHSSYKNGRRR